MSTELPTFVELTSSSKAKRYTEQERNHYCEEWKKSGLSMSQYCQRANVTVSSLSKWINENKIMPAQKVEALPSSSSHQAVEIILLSGIRVRFSRLNMSELMRIINGIEICN